jgi:hypothetical protein
MWCRTGYTIYTCLLTILFQSTVYRYVGCALYDNLHHCIARLPLKQAEKTPLRDPAGVLKTGHRPVTIFTDLDRTSRIGARTWKPRLWMACHYWHGCFIDIHICPVLVSAFLNLLLMAISASQPYLSFSVLRPKHFITCIVLFHVKQAMFHLTYKQHLEVGTVGLNARIAACTVFCV